MHRHLTLLSRLNDSLMSVVTLRANAQAERNMIVAGP
jgi:hypothetical protein